MKMNTDRIALIAGSTGIVGRNLAALLLEQGWTVYGLARRPSSAGGAIPLAADLLDRGSLAAALTNVAPTIVFFVSLLRQPTYAAILTDKVHMTHHLFTHHLQ